MSHTHCRPCWAPYHCHRQYTQRQPYQLLLELLGLYTGSSHVPPHMP
eukprot:XP_001703832.1 Hypothetical protein GL50803_119006 [Giardia lamblia ATCC 50803]